MAMKIKYTIQWLFFEYTGRIRRLTYFLSGVFFVMLYTYLTVVIVQTPETSPIFGWLGLAFLGLMGISLWAVVALSVKRLHDLGFPGTLAVAMFIPMVTFIFFFVLCLFKGNPGSNKYGKSPIVS